MPLNYQLVVPPAVEPISLSQAKAQLRIDIPDENDLIQSYIEVAREYAESYTNRAFYPQTYRLYLDSFPYGDYRSTVPMDQRSPWSYSAYWTNYAIRLPRPMAQSVVAINYLDSVGNPVVLNPSTYYVDLNSRPARIVPQIGAMWPMTQFYLPGSINVEYVAASYVSTITETIALTGAGPYVGTPARQVINIVSIKDTNGSTLAYTASVVLDDNGDPTDKTQISLSSNPVGGVVVVTYVAGMLPASIRRAMLLLIGDAYENREATSALNLKNLPLGVNENLRRYKFVGRVGSDE